MAVIIFLVCFKYSVPRYSCLLLNVILHFLQPPPLRVDCYRTVARHFISLCSAYPIARRKSIFLLSACKLSLVWFSPLFLLRISFLSFAIGVSLVLLFVSLWFDDSGELNPKLTAILVAIWDFEMERHFSYFVYFAVRMKINFYMLRYYENV